MSLLLMAPLEITVPPPGASRAPDLYARWAQLGGLAVATIGGFARAGWTTGSTLLKAGAPGFIPMAPNTALRSVALGLAPVGRMAFFTALAFVFAASAVVTRTVEHRRRVVNDLARASVIVSTLIGLVFLTGYGYGSPLLYGGRAIPMALPTAAADAPAGISPPSLPPPGRRTPIAR